MSSRGFDCAPGWALHALWSFHTATGKAQCGWLGGHSAQSGLRLDTGASGAGSSGAAVPTQGRWECRPAPLPLRRPAPSAALPRRLAPPAACRPSRAGASRAPRLWAAGHGPSGGRGAGAGRTECSGGPQRGGERHGVGGRGHPRPPGLEAAGLARCGDAAHRGNAGAARARAQPGR